MDGHCTTFPHSRLARDGAVIGDRPQFIRIKAIQYLRNRGLSPNTLRLLNRRGGRVALVTQDYVVAHKWYNLAAAAGNADAVKMRDLVAYKMTSTQIAEAQRMAQEWLLKKEK